MYWNHGPCVEVLPSLGWLCKDDVGRSTKGGHLTARSAFQGPHGILIAEEAQVICQKEDCAIRNSGYLSSSLAITPEPYFAHGVPDGAVSDTGVRAQIKVSDGACYGACNCLDHA